MGSVKVILSEARRFMVDCMSAVCTPLSHGEALAELLLAADMRGHYSHGMNRLEMYVRDIQKKLCDATAVPRIIKQSPSTAYVSGRNGLGVVVGNYCMSLAIEKATMTGVGWITATNSNHYGMAAWYSMQALRHGMIGITCSNTSPLMSPTRSKRAALGTNPISVAAPGMSEDDCFVLDMATTTVSLGKIEIQRRKGQPIPDSWAQGPDGNMTTDPTTAYETRCLMPLGGPEEKSGYKGYGLALIVEALTGIAGGGAFGPNIREWTQSDRIADIGHCFIAVDVGRRFAPSYNERVSDMAAILKNLPPADNRKRVMLPGDPERRNERKATKENKLHYSENQIKSCVELAAELKVQPLTVEYEKF